MTEIKKRVSMFFDPCISFKCKDDVYKYNTLKDREICLKMGIPLSFPEKDYDNYLAIASKFGFSIETIGGI